MLYIDFSISYIIWFWLKFVWFLLFGTICTSDRFAQYDRLCNSIFFTFLGIFLGYVFNNDGECPSPCTPPCNRPCSKLDKQICAYSKTLNKYMQFINECVLGVYNCQHPQESSVIIVFGTSNYRLIKIPL